MASVFLYHVVGDLTVGKPELVEFSENETIESAIRAIGDSTECGIPVWKRKPQKGLIETTEMRQIRFVGILNSFDIVTFLAKDRCLENQEMAMKTPVSEVVIPNSSLLKEVHPATRLIDALEIMKQGVKRLLVPTSVGWKCVSKKFSVLYNGRWLKNGSSNSLLSNINRPSTSTTNIIQATTFCCLSREDIARFLIGCLGALAPIPLSPISSLETINTSFSYIEASLPAIEAILKVPLDPNAIAVVDPMPDGRLRIIGEISACNLWKCDHLAAAYALATLSAGQFVMGVEDSLSPLQDPDTGTNMSGRENNMSNGSRPRKFSSRSIGFFNNTGAPTFGCPARSMYRGRSAPLTCKASSSLAAIMAQMLSHRATHVWVTEGEDDFVVGVVGYREILHAVTRPPPPTVS